MPSLSATLAQLTALRRQAAQDLPSADDHRFAELTGFGSNPGALRALIYLPETVVERPPLVVVLHGCTQTAADYAIGAGWRQLADRHGFALLLPEQRRENNPNLCFNWFVPADQRREGGEAASIRQMVAAMVDRHGVDPARIFVTGLSAGGAMAAVMLATYPEVFACGAIVAGLAYGCANSVPQAFERMRGHNLPDATALSALVRAASPHDGPWPTVSIWQGGADTTVNPGNAAALVSQWCDLHGTASAPSRLETVDGHPRRVWHDAAGREVVEEYRIAGMGHGTPLDTRGADACGVAGAFLLEAGISSTRHIVRFWSIDGAVAQSLDVASQDQATRPSFVPVVRTKRPERIPLADDLKGAREKPPLASGVGRVIEDALRAAGLMH